ncbi:GntR family transcriptional regulator [Candidatus Bipolaricaulota bacterium]|nr:GntR family transcriptional regulator [Candidatus Bipolaricaulota bacterium]
MSNELEPDDSRLGMPYSSKVDYVYNILLENIIRGKLSPGTRLKEKRLADEFGVSNTPVREALKKLKREGLVETRSHKGSYVTQVNEEEAKEIYEIRESLEGLAAKRAVKKVSEEQVNRLKEIIQGMEDKLTEDDLKGYGQLNEKFHNKLAKISGKRAYKYIRELRNQSKVLMQYPGEIRPKTSLKEHKKIMEAIASRNASEVERAVRKHIRNAKEDVLETMTSD